jgi:hypothetical protein
MNTSPTWYEIRVEGGLTSEWVEWFDGLDISQQNHVTRLTGPVVDQAALYGLLKKVRDLGLVLVSVNPISSQSQKE